MKGVREGGITNAVLEISGDSITHEVDAFDEASPSSSGAQQLSHEGGNAAAEGAVVEATSQAKTFWAAGSAACDQDAYWEAACEFQEPSLR